MKEEKQFKKYDLDKGAKLYYVKNKINKSTNVKILFESGARCDSIPGIAHFTEHMFFTGTETQTKEEISKEYFDFLGTNATTSYDSISFEGTIFTSKFNDYLALVSKLITKTTFSPEAVEKEKPIVVQEIVNYNDKFRMKASSFNSYNLSKREEIIYDISGSEKTVNSITSEEVKAFVKKYFVANNVKVFVCAPLSASKVKKCLNDTLISALDVNPDLPILSSFYYSIVDDKFYKIKNVDINKSYIFINFKLNHGYKDFDFYDKIVAITSMCNDYSTGVMRDLRLKKSLVYGGGFSWVNYKDNGRVTFATECQKENVNEVIKTMFEYLKRMSKTGFGEGQLDIVKQRRGHFKIQDVNTPSRLLGRLENFRDYGKILPEDSIDVAIENITVPECNELFKEIFVTDNVSLTIYGDAKKEDVMTKAEFKKLFLK